MIPGRERVLMPAGVVPSFLSLCSDLSVCMCEQKREREQKRKLQHFLGDLALLGSLQVWPHQHARARSAHLSQNHKITLLPLQGFKYFQPWLRGKEELLLTVVNEDLVSFCRETG